MIITSIEVIRGNHGISANPGLAVQALPGEKVELTYGDTLRVNVSFDYRGPAMKTTLEGAIGEYRAFPTERFIVILKDGVEIDLPKSPDFTPCERSVDIGITDDIDPGTDYDLSISLLDYREAGHPTIVDVIDIVGIPPTFEEIQHTIYPFAYIYDGDAEVNIATFKIDPFTPSAWAAKRFADALESEARKKGARVLETKVYVDTTPLLWTDIRIEVTGTPLGEEVGTVAGRGIAVGIAPWLAIILVCLAIIAVIVVATLAFKTVMGYFGHKPGLEAVKPGWTKETLILTIQDSEEYWERPPTPVETLEEMPEEELRNLLDQIAEEEVPEEVSWLPLAILGGLGILGVGGIAAAYAMSKPKERK